MLWQQRAIGTHAYSLYVYRNNSYLFVKVEHLQKLNGRQNAGYVELVGYVEDGLQVFSCERVQYSAIHQLVVEDLRVLRQPDVTQPAFRHPVMVHISSFWEPGVNK